MTLKISYKLEQQILLMFPTEKLEYYRCDRRGKIYSRFCYLRQSLKNIEKKQSAPESHDGSKVIYEDVAADAVKRLRYENVDASELNELWQLSSSSRLEKIVNDCLSLSDIFKLWPEYKKPTGYRLIDLDFKHLYSSANDILDIFEPKMKKLYDFFSKPNTLKDSNCSVLLKKLTDDVVAKGDTSYIFTTLWCLHEYLFPTGRVVQKDNTGKKITRRFTIKDSQELVCFVGQSVQQLEQFISFQKSRNLNI
ncbi:uncharacterized protein LOC119665909 [Teleopsis dalmanni]|uniref:uncharacterized protein LOC119665909 n=1 Tax=Teleopsis dalmanni TaxID=139649 RepID=UPI0018CD4FFB|nr:uncharacterized protein LOC119665909 [Teleopsis dalmanni]